MSSARSISGARARRAGEQAPTVTPQQLRSQPQYISSGQPMPMQGQRPIPGQLPQQFSPRPIGQQQPQPPRPIPSPVLPNQNPGTSGPTQLPGKISISDAFNIVTSRISKIEKFMQELTQPPSDEELQQMQKQQEEENNILPIIMERVDRLEQTGLGEIANNKIVEIKNQLVKTQRDLKETKEVIFSIQSNYDTLAFELNDKIERKYNELYEMIVINQGNIHPMVPPTIDSESVDVDIPFQEQERIEELDFEEEVDVHVDVETKENIILDFHISDDDSVSESNFSKSVEI
jgi:hypothetical protein